MKCDMDDSLGLISPDNSEHQEGVSLPEKPQEHQEGVSLPEKPQEYQKSVLPPEKPQEHQEGVSLHEKLKEHQECVSLHEKPKEHQEGVSLPKKPQEHQEGAFLPEKPQEHQEGISLSEKPQEHQECVSLHENPNEHQEDVLLPEKPQEPHSNDCCGNGCDPCVFDIYEEELKIWKNECDRIKYVKTGKVISDKVESVICPQEYQRFVLSNIVQETSNSYTFTFDIPSGEKLGLKVGQHLILRWQDKKNLTRQYTPISDLSAKGYFDVLIKIYPEGQMSQYIRSWCIGDEVEWRGPFGCFTYKANSYSKVIMLAAGTGIAPMLQVIRYILNNEEDETLVRLIYCCQRYQDLLMKPLLDEWSGFWNFSVLYVLSKEIKESPVQKRYQDKIHYGRLDEYLLQQETESLTSNTLFLICGTWSFEKDMINYIKRMCVEESNIFKF